MIQRFNFWIDSSFPSFPFHFSCSGSSSSSSSSLFILIFELSEFINFSLWFICSSSQSSSSVPTSHLIIHLEGFSYHLPFSCFILSLTLHKDLILLPVHPHHLFFANLLEIFVLLWVILKGGNSKFFLPRGKFFHMNLYVLSSSTSFSLTSFGLHV